MSRFSLSRVSPRSAALGAVLALLPSLALADKLTATIVGARNANGVVRCGLFASADGFRQPGRQAFEAESPISNGSAVCVFNNVPAGRYALAVFHAEKGEQTIQYGLFGKPEEGVGFSQNPSITFGAPSFDAAAFNLSGTQTMTIKLNY